MDIQRLLRRYRGDWKELEDLLALFAGEPDRIQASQIRRLIHLYRKVSAHLALLQARNPEDELTLHLNQLAARAHHMVYKQEPHNGRQLSDFFGRYFIGLIRQRKMFILAAFMLVLLGGASGFIAVLLDPASIYGILPAQIADNVDPSRLGEGLSSSSHSIISAQIMTNNIRVAVLAFAAGVTFGLGTVYLLVYNGLMVGALAALYWKADATYPFWAYILPHGVIELTAIFIAGGSGLYMGYRMWVPGRYPWRLQLLQNAKESVQLLLGTIPMFVTAAVIEGYITPSALSLETKYAVAVLTLLLLAGYYLYGRRKERRKPDATPSHGSAAPDIG